MRCSRPNGVALASIALALTMAGTPGAAAAPPPNDGFTAAEHLGSETSTSTFGSNAEATLQNGEPDPTGNGGASVWYSWTAPADGWVAVSTLGSDFDTLLYVFTGSALSFLDLVARDDDASPSELQSLVRFHASAGTTYRIAVHGYQGEEGVVLLGIDTLAAPPLHLTSLTVATPPSDLAAADGTAVLHVGVFSPNGFSDGSVGLSNPSGGLPDIAFTRFDAGDRIEGDAQAGTYAVSVPLPRYGEPGNWPVDLQLADDLDDNVRYGHPTSGTVFPAGITTTDVAATNTGSADTTAPTLNALWFEPTNVDVSDSPQEITLSLDISDDLAGTESAIVDVLDPSGAFYQRHIATADSIVAGDTNDGTFTVTFTVPRFVEPGTYTIDDFFPVDLSDRTGNVRSYGPFHTPFPPGATTTFTVVNTSGTDTGPPVLTGADIDPVSIDIGQAPATATVTFTATDDLAGVVGGTVGIELEDGSLAWTPFDASDRTAGTPTLGTYTVPLTLSPGQVTPGTYPLVITLEDDSSFTAEYGGTFGDPVPGNGTHELEVTDSGPGPSPFEAWIANYPSLSGPAADPLADPDGDGFVNLTELPFGLDPTRDSSPGGNDPNRSNAPTLTKTPSTLSLTYTLVPGNLSAHGHVPIAVTPRSSTDLRSHTSLTPTDLGENRYRATLPVATSPPSAFLDVEVSLVP